MGAKFPKFVTVVMVEFANRLLRIKDDSTLARARKQNVFSLEDFERIMRRNPDIDFWVTEEREAKEGEPAPWRIPGDAWVCNKQNQKRREQEEWRRERDRQLKETYGS